MTPSLSRTAVSRKSSSWCRMEDLPRKLKSLAGTYRGLAFRFYLAGEHPPRLRSEVAEYQFELLPTGQRPHFTVRLRSTDGSEFDRLLAALRAPQANSQYAGGKIWREED
jgi:hypothetical protein